MHCLYLVEMFPLNSICFNIQSVAILKSAADSGSSCFAPVCTSDFPVNSLFNFAIALVPKSVNTINFINLDAILYSFRLSVTLFLLIESKACR